jgi:hypothetical protein
MFVRQARGPSFEIFGPYYPDRWVPTDTGSGAEGKVEADHRSSKRQREVATIL